MRSFRPPPHGPGPLVGPQKLKALLVGVHSPRQCSISINDSTAGQQAHLNQPPPCDPLAACVLASFLCRIVSVPLSCSMS